MLAAEGRPGSCISCIVRYGRSVSSTRSGKHVSIAPARSYRKPTIRRQPPRVELRLGIKGRTSVQSWQPSRIKETFSMVTERKNTRYSDLKQIILERLELLSVQLKDSQLLEALGLKKNSFSENFANFRYAIISTYLTTAGPHVREAAMFESLRQAYVDKGEQGLDAQLKYAFYGHVTSARFTESDVSNQIGLADLRYPVEWFPATRATQRTLHLHVGPTNSGKTYHALKRLEEAESGLYAGPLRLLAHEVYTRLNAKGIRCNLITGDDRRVITEEEAAKMTACTVEMVPLNQDLDIAVIDEIQMIGSKERGWAWTQALLGLKAKEFHLCGEERAVPLIRELAAMMGDKLEIHKYQRLSPLRAMTTSLNGDLQRLRKGDCVVVFSRVGIHAMKLEIEKYTGKRVAVVYGSLPPEIRAQQAKLFNDPDNDYDILVASDAIGMGLNLSIKRIIFESLLRHDGTSYKRLPISDIKQIGGRAGRFRTAVQDTRDVNTKRRLGNTDKVEDGKDPGLPRSNLGLVTSLETDDLPSIREAMQSEAPPILSAGIFPPANIVQKFATYFPHDTPFSYILLRLHEISRLSPRFHLCSLHEHLGIADVIQPFKNLSVSDRLVICQAPVGLRDRGMPGILAAYSRCVAEQRGGSILNIPDLKLEILDKQAVPGREYLRQLEFLHKALVLYLWLSYRFAGVFTSRATVVYLKTLVEDRIDRVLADYANDGNFRLKMKTLRELSMIENLKRQLVANKKPQQKAVNDDTLPSSLDEVSLTLAADDTSSPIEEQVAAAA